MSTSEELYEAVLKGKPALALAATNAAIEAGMIPNEIINGCMIPAMEEVGKRFEEGKAFVPELLMAGQAMKKALEVLKPLMVGESSFSAGKIVMGTVQGDLHDIGKNLVASMLEGCGFEVINLGTNVSSQKFIDAVKEHKAQILGMSALLTTTMAYMKEVIDALKEVGLRDQVKVMVGGAPLSESFAESIGADGFSSNANSAVALARSLV